jgi:hypothetical protein
VCGQGGCLASQENRVNLVNREHFLGLDEQLQGREWNQYRIEASFHLNSVPASIYQFTLMQDRATR